MTVAELIARLSELPPDLPVTTESISEGTYDQVEVVPGSVLLRRDGLEGWRNEDGVLVFSPHVEIGG